MKTLIIISKIQIKHFKVTSNFGYDNNESKFQLINLCNLLNTKNKIKNSY